MEASSSSVQDDWVTMGEVSGVFGVKGWVKIFSYTEPKQNILNFKNWTLESSRGRESVRFEKGQIHGKGLIVKLEGFDNREDLAPILKNRILISRSELPVLAEDDYYWNDLIGLQVYNLQEQFLGVVDHILETGANDVMVAKEGGLERLVPYIWIDVVKEVDLSKGKMLVDWDAEF